VFSPGKTPGADDEGGDMEAMLSRAREFRREHAEYVALARKASKGSAARYRLMADHVLTEAIRLEGLARTFQRALAA
jgi:hypothetical protein